MTIHSVKSGLGTGLLVASSLSCGVSIAQPEAIPVEQRDWPDYFPGIPCKASVYEPDFERVDMSYLTPHMPWARPYYGGKIRALVLAARVSHRDTVELAQRLDMKFDAISAFSRLKLGGSDSGRYDMPVGCTEVEQRLKLKHLLKNDYDVMIIGKMNADAIPKELQDKIREKVMAGMGLVINYFGGEETVVVPSWVLEAKECLPEESEQICNGVPFGALDFWNEYKTVREAAEKLVKCRTLGKGRIAIIRIGGNASRGYLVPAPIKFKEEIKLWPVDYYISLTARATAWAAGKPPLGKVECAVEGKEMAVKIGGIRDGWDELEVSARDVQGEEVYRGISRATKRELPDLAAGEYLVDVIVRKGGKTLNWGSTVFKVEKECRIEEVKAKPRGVKPGEEFTISVKLTAGLKEAGVLEARVEEAVGVASMGGRLIAVLKKEMAAGQDGAEMSGKLDNSLGNLVRIRITLRVGENIISKNETWLPVNQPYPRDDFGFVSWDLASPEYNWYYARRELVKLGVDSSYGGKSYQQAWILATSGFRPIPYMTRYAISRTTPGPCHERMPCLSDPEYIKKEQEKIRKSVEEMSVFGPAGYSLGDENDLSLNDHEVCFSPSCRTAFREYVKKIYAGNLAAVNFEWGTTNKSWEEIEPMPLWEARAKKQPSRWVDFRSSMENVFLKIHQIGAETVKSVDVGALAGFDGGYDITSFTGYDWWKLSRILDVWGIYPDHLQAEILRSFHLPGTRTGRWYGGYYNITRFEEYAHWEPWYDLFHEMNNVWWFNIIGTDGGGCQAEDTMNPAAFKPFPILAATAEETREIKSGIGKLLLGCRRDSGGIAILYSQASLHAATFYGMSHKPPDSQFDFIRILEDLGYSYRFVSYDQVQEGILQKGSWKMLVLPCAVALSKGEREQICAFIKKGGKVLADDMPGIYDEHGKETDDPVWRGVIDGEARVMGGAIRNYRREASYGGAMRRYMKAILQDMEIEPEIRLKTEKKEVYEGELAVFKDGQATYVGLLRHHTPVQNNQNVEIILPQSGFIYDMRNGRFLGHAGKIKTVLKAGRAGLWAVLPEKTGELKLAVTAEVKPGEKAHYNLEIDDALRHVIRIEVLDGERRPHMEYGRNLECKNGKAEGFLPLALNDAPGRWTIIARDIVGGSVVRKTLLVK